MIGTEAARETVVYCETVSLVFSLSLCPIPLFGHFPAGRLWRTISPKPESLNLSIEEVRVMSSPTGEWKGSAPEIEAEERESPSEKLRDETPTGEQVPGAQNPESEEVKKEFNPNTE
jgi:hypothetical protein